MKPAWQNKFTHLLGRYYLEAVCVALLASFSSPCFPVTLFQAGGSGARGNGRSAGDR